MPTRLQTALQPSTATTRRPSSCGRGGALVYDFLSGFQRQNEDGSTTLENGRLALFRNFDEHGNPLPRPGTLLIDSEQLESGEALDDDFRAMAADEIDRLGGSIRCVVSVAMLTEGGTPTR